AEYGVKRTCISDVLKQFSKWLNIDTTNKAEANHICDCQPKWLKLDEAMCIWTESALVANIDLTQTDFITKAKVFTTALNISDFK
ncbi:16613_t:CDS:1, partial [Cetraspora pellucida]